MMYNMVYQKRTFLDEWVQLDSDFFLLYPGNWLTDRVCTSSIMHL